MLKGLLQQSRGMSLSGLMAGGLTLALTLTSACSKLGNQELLSGTAGMRIAKVAGDRQVGPPSQLFKGMVSVHLTDDSGKALPGIPIDFQLTDETGSATLSTPSALSDARGNATVQVKAPASYGTTIFVAAQPEGSTSKTQFQLQTSTTGLGNKYLAETTNLGVETAGVKFGYKIKVVDDLDNVVASINETRDIIWNFSTQNSWGGNAPLNPLGQVSCKFVGGVCLWPSPDCANLGGASVCSTANPAHSAVANSGTNFNLGFVLMDTRKPSYFWVGDGPGGLIDVSAQPVTVVPNVKNKILMANLPGGPAGVDTLLSTTADNAILYATGAIIVSADLPVVKIFAVAGDSFGNYYSDLTDVTWSGTDSATPTAPLVFSASGAPQTYGINYLPHLSGANSLVASSASMGSVTQVLAVNPGLPFGFDITATAVAMAPGPAPSATPTAAPALALPKNEVWAGLPFALSIRAVDSQGNTLAGDYNVASGLFDGPNSFNGNIPTRLSYTGTYASAPALGGGCPTFTGAGQFLNSTIYFGTVCNNTINYPTTLPPPSVTGVYPTYNQPFIQGVANSQIWGFLNDATSVTPKVSVVTTANGTLPALTSTSATITVRKSQPHHLMAYTTPAEGNALCNFLFPFHSRYEYINTSDPAATYNSVTATVSSHCGFLTAGAPTTLYAVTEDAGGNYLANVPVNWLNNDVSPAPDGKSAVYNLSTESNTGGHTNTIYLHVYHAIDMQLQSGSLSDGATVTELVNDFNPAPLHHWLIQACTTTAPSQSDCGSNQVYADQNYSLQIAAKDQFGNGVPIGLHTIKTTYSAAGNSPKGTAPILPSGVGTYQSVTFLNNGSFGENALRYPLANQNFSVTVTDGTISTTQAFNSVSGPATRMELRDAAGGAGTLKTSINQTYTIDQSPTDYAIAYDSEDNLASQVFTATWTLSNSAIGTWDLTGPQSKITATAPGTGILSAAVSYANNRAAANTGPATFSLATGNLTFSPGALDHIRLIATGLPGPMATAGPSTALAGSNFQISAQLEDAKNNVLTSVSGAVPVGVTLIDSTATAYGYQMPAGVAPLGTQNLNFSNGILTAPLSFTLYNSLDTPTLQMVNTTLGSGPKVGQIVFNVTPAALDHISFKSSSSSMSAGASGVYTLKALDRYGNLIATGAPASMSVVFTQGNSLLNQTISSTTLTGSSYTGPAGHYSAVSGSLSAGSATVTLTSQGAGSIAATGSAGLALPQNHANVFDTLTVNPLTTISSVAWNPAPPTAYTASGTVTMKSSYGPPVVYPKAELRDTYGNVIATNSGATVTLSKTGTAGSLGGTLAQSTINGVATFNDLTFALPGTITLVATEGVSSVASPGAAVTATTTPATQAIAIIQGESQVGGQTTFDASVTGIIPARNAGTAFLVTVRAVDDSFNLVSTYTGPISLGFTGLNAADAQATATPTSGCTTNFVAGECQFNVVFRKAGGAMSVAPGSGLSSNRTSHNFVINRGAVSDIIALLPGQTLLEGSTTPIRGTPSAALAVNTDMNVDVYAIDPYFNVNASDSTTVATLSFVSPALPIHSDYSTRYPSGTTLSAGHGLFTFKWWRAFDANSSASSVQVDPVGASLTTNRSVSFNIAAGVATQSLVLLPGETLTSGVTTLGAARGGTATTTQNAGLNFTATAYVLDALFNRANVNPTISLITTDPNDSDPSLTLSGGMGTVNVNHRTATASAIAKITASGTGVATNPDSTLYQIIPHTSRHRLTLLSGQSLNPGNSCAYANAATVGSPGITGAYTAQTAGTPFTVTNAIVDDYCNTVNITTSTGYMSTNNGAVSNTDPNVTDGVHTFSLTNGSGSVAITLRTAGTRQVTPSFTDGSINASWYEASSPITLNAAAPSVLRFVSPATVVNGGYCQPYTAKTYDAFGAAGVGNLANVTISSTITFGGNGAGAFYTDSNCSSAGSAVTVASGQNSGTIYFKTMSGGAYTLSASISGDFSAPAASNVALTVNNVPTLLAFTSPTASTLQGQCVQIDVTTEDTGNTPRVVFQPGGLAVGIAQSGAGSVTLYPSQALCTSTTNVAAFSATIAQGQSLASFWVRGSAAGPTTFTASGTGLTDGTFSFTVNATAALTATPALASVTTPNTTRVEMDGGVRGAVSPFYTISFTTNSSGSTMATTPGVYTGFPCAAGKVCFNYTPGPLGNGRVDTFTIQDAAYPQNTATASITVNGASLAFTTTNGAWGTQTMNSDLTQTVTNQGNAAQASGTMTVTIANCKLNGTTDGTCAAWAINTSACAGAPLASGATCATAVTFKASTAVSGSHTADLIITAAPGTPAAGITVPMTGTK